MPECVRSLEIPLLERNRAQQLGRLLSRSEEKLLQSERDSSWVRFEVPREATVVSMAGSEGMRSAPVNRTGATAVSVVDSTPRLTASGLCCDTLTSRGPPLSGGLGCFDTLLADGASCIMPGTLRSLRPDGPPARRHRLLFTGILLRAGKNLGASKYVRVCLQLPTGPR